MNKLQRVKILVIGGSGMAGHMIATYLSEKKYDVFITIRNKNPKLNKNIGQIIWKNTNFDSLKKIIDNNFNVIINSVGILNTFADNNQSEAILLNSYLPHFLVKLTEKTNTKIIHLSTDCVFSGKKGEYKEDSIKDGISFYDLTKSIGEFSNNKDIVFRNSIVGPDLKQDGIGLFNWFMHQSNEINGYDNWYWSGITTLELAKKIEIAILNKYNGLYHLTNNQKISKYQLLELFNKNFNKNLKINKISLAKKIDKSLIDTQKKDIFYIPSYEIMILEMKEWITNHLDLYSYRIF